MTAAVEVVPAARAQDGADRAARPRAARRTPVLRRRAPTRGAARRPTVASTGVVAGRARSPVLELDVRLHSPLAGVVVVWVEGAVDERSVAVLAARIGQQFDRAAHVVVDLAWAPDLYRSGVAALLDLHRQARARGVGLHIAGGERTPWACCCVRRGWTACSTWWIAPTR